MTNDEFAETCKRRGYCREGMAREWMRLHPKESYTEEDAESCYNWASNAAWERIRKADLERRDRRKNQD